MNKPSFTSLIVGTQYELFKGRNMQGQDGAIIEMLQDGRYVLIVYLAGMTLEEQIALKTSKIHVRVIKETDDFILTLIRYGNSPLIFEMSFDPTLYSDERRKLFTKSNMLHIIGVDSNTNIIKTLRYCSMPYKLFDVYKDAFKLALTRENFSQKYKNWVDDLDQRYTTVQLWGIAKNYGQMGQSEWV
jgi:hypothetical protein